MYSRGFCRRVGPSGEDTVISHTAFKSTHISSPPARFEGSHRGLGHKRAPYGSSIAPLRLRSGSALGEGHSSDGSCRSQGGH